MKNILRKTASAVGILCLFAAGGKAIPMLDAIQIGCVQEPAAEVIAATEPASTETQPIESGVVMQTEQYAAPSPAVPSNVIPYESDGSKAMWNARPYQCADTSTGGKIIEKHFGTQSGTMFFSLPGGGQVRNSTFWSNADLKKESQISPELDIKLDGSPMVLIYHTHTTESYPTAHTNGYDAGFTFRTTEPDKNMVAVGDAIAEQLSAAGIGVVHAGEIHDFPVWSGAYSRSAETIKEILEAYPSICVALDIHRDAISDGSTVIAPVCEINGKQSAQIMIISGCDDGTMNMPTYQKNFHFASRLQETAETMFPGFTRPILFDYRKYNQDLTTGSLLIEVGSQGNTLEEARYAGELTGRALSETLIALANAKGESQ